MKEALISFECAKLAKEKGFEIPTCNYYNIQEPDRIVTVAAFNHNYKAHGNVTVSAPAQSLLQKWLREEHNVEVWVVPIFGVVPEDTMYEAHVMSITSVDYNTYEEALEEGLRDALLLIN